MPDFFRYAGIPTLQYGPSTPSGIHSYNETAEVTDVVNIAKVYLCTIVDFLNKKIDGRSCFMRIEQIGQILEIVECGSIGKAAQKLYMQQPNLSMAVKAVEEEFHQPIFLPYPKRGLSDSVWERFSCICRAIL